MLTLSCPVEFTILLNCLKLELHTLQTLTRSVRESLCCRSEDVGGCVVRVRVVDCSPGAGPTITVGVAILPLAGAAGDLWVQVTCTVVPCTLLLSGGLTQHTTAHRAAGVLAGLATLSAVRALPTACRPARGG